MDQLGADTSGPGPCVRDFNHFSTASANNRPMTPAELRSVLNWTKEKLATGAEPPWAWYQYMKLREALEAILSGMEATTLQTESSPQLEAPSGSGLRLVDSNTQPDSVEPLPTGLPVRLPM